MLRVNAAWIEPGCDSWDVATELASELKIMAEWLSLQAVEIPREGTSHRPRRCLMGRPVSVQSRQQGAKRLTIGDALRHSYDG